MRDDLGIYLKLLRSAMIDLINRDYTDFVNLSSNLIGLDKAINDLQAPLGQLREEVMVKWKIMFEKNIRLFKKYVFHNQINYRNFISYVSPIYI